MISLGTYPEITLAPARARSDEYRALVAQGIDPCAQHQAAKVAADDSFEVIARGVVCPFCPREG